MSKELEYFPPAGVGQFNWHPKRLTYSSWISDNIGRFYGDTFRCYMKVDLIRGKYTSCIDIAILRNWYWIRPTKQCVTAADAIILVESVVNKVIGLIFSESWYLEAVQKGWTPPDDFCPSLLEIEGCIVETKGK